MFENEYTWGKAIANNTVNEFDEKFEKAFEEFKANLGKNYPIIINGEKIFLDNKFDVKSPSDIRIIVAKFPQATKEDTISTTTAALVQSQPFVGWKESGISGKGSGEEQYIQQFLQAQTQTRCD